MRDRSVAFLRRQFDAQPTVHQRLSDLAVLWGLCPLVLYVAGTTGDASLMAGPEVRAVLVVAALSHAFDLLTRLVRSPGRTHELLLAGTYGAGAVVSGAIGLLLLPFALLTVVLAIGWFLLVPTVAAICLARNAVRCLRRADCSWSDRTVVATVVTPAVFCLALGSAIGWQTRAAAAHEQQLVMADPLDHDVAVQHLRWLREFGGVWPDRLLERAIDGALDPALSDEELQPLFDAYRQITGERLDRLDIQIDHALDHT